MTDWPNPDEWNLAPLDHTISGKFLLDDCDLCVHIRELETWLADRDRRLAQLRTAWDGENEMRRKSEADLAEIVKVRDDFTRRGFHRCGSDTTLCYCAHMDEDLVSERNALKNENVSHRVICR